MKTRVQKWGNSLAIRIPKTLAEEAGFKENAPVRLVLGNNALVVSHVLTLENLLAGVNDLNMHGETRTGMAVGSEVW